MPDDWDIVFKDTNNNVRLDCTKAPVVIFGSVKELIKEKDELMELVKRMKKEMATMKGEITNLKTKMKEND